MPPSPWSATIGDCPPVARVSAACTRCSSSSRPLNRSPMLLGNGVGVSLGLSASAVFSGVEAAVGGVARLTVKCTGTGDGVGAASVWCLARPRWWCQSTSPTISSTPIVTGNNRRSQPAGQRRITYSGNFSKNFSKSCSGPKPVIAIRAPASAAKPIWPRSSRNKPPRSLGMQSTIHPEEASTNAFTMSAKTRARLLFRCSECSPDPGNIFEHASEAITGSRGLAGGGTIPLRPLAGGEGGAH